MRNIKSALCMIFMACLGCGTAWTQTSSASPAPSTAVAPQQDSSETTNIRLSNLGHEPVGPGDLLYIEVSGAPEMTRSYRVAPDGMLSLPMLKKGILVTGLVPNRVSDAVSDELIKEGVFVSPIIATSVLDYRSRRVDVMGAVRYPTTVEAVGNMKLLDALAKAQGFAPEAGSELIVSRRGSDGQDESIHILIKQLLSGTDSSLNVALRGGEEIRVPEAAKIYVLGNVRMPGSFPLHDAEGATVLKALAQSQGTLPFTSKRAFIYRMAAGSTARQEIPVPLHEMLHRKVPDMDLQANDVLYIPENTTLKINAGVLEALTGFGGDLGTRFLIWH